MIDKAGAPKVIEFNVRFGDPETQPIMMRLRPDLLEHIEHAIDGHLQRSRAPWDPRPALGVVIAAQGYHGTHRPVNTTNTSDAPDVEATTDFHAGTPLDRDPPVTPPGPPLRHY